MVTIILVYFICVLFFVFLIKSSKKPAQFPPGPSWLPIIGPLEIKKTARKFKCQHLALSDLAAKYKTDVLGLKLGSEPVIVVFGYDNIHKILKNDEYDGRPDNFFMRLRSMGTQKGITGTDGPHWEEQRRFMMRHLRDVGFGKKSMELKIAEEIKTVIDIIDTTGPIVKIGRLIAPSILNVLWIFTAGTSISRDDPRLEKLLNLLYKRSRAFDMAGGILNQFPWLRFVAPEKTGYNLIVGLNAELKNFIMAAIDEHRNSYDDDKANDFMYAFIKEMKTCNGQKTRFTDDQLMMVCLDIFIAGSESTSGTLSFIFLMMLLYPEIQRRVQMEIDSVVPKDKMPEMADKPRLPFVEAVITEVQRFKTIITVGGPRRVLRDTRLGEFKIPKDTTVLMSFWSVHSDKTYWKDPEVFRPDRFINSDGKYIPSPDHVIPFGLGRRRCPGELLARNAIFLFFTGILHKYDIRPVPGCPLPSADPIPGITSIPEPYDVSLIRRHF